MDKLAWQFQNSLLTTLLVLLIMLTFPTLASDYNSIADARATSKQDISFLRVQRDAENKPLSLDTAVVRYQSLNAEKEQLTVDLVSTVHVADAEYYSRLNKLFESYDAVLYELVAPEGTRIKMEDKKKANHAVGKVQLSIKDILELSFQLSKIDYNKDNFIHADMSPTEFKKSMNDRGESFADMIFRMMLQSMAMQGQNQGSNDLQFLFALLSKDRALRLKRLLAVQFEDLDMTMIGFSGKTGSTIISERNKKALQVLTKQIGLKKKKIAIYYGAGHMQDMHRRLLKDFNMKMTQQQWLPAWHLSFNQ